MNAFLNSLKADLLDRRLRALALLLGAGLVAAFVYALSGGSSTQSSPPTLPVPQGAGGLSATAVTAGANGAVAETTSGASQQRAGTGRDPFTPLPGSVAPLSTSASSSAKSSGSGSASTQSSSGSAGKGAQGSGGTSPAPTKPITPAKPAPSYDVAILLGVLPAGVPPQEAQLTPYEDLRFQQKLPSPEKRLLSYAGVTSGGKRATFKLVGEAILRGIATCLPSASQCESIALEQGQSEELEYLPPGGGPPVVYELQVVSITSANASAASAGTPFAHSARVLLVAPERAYAPAR